MSSRVIVVILIPRWFKGRFGGQRILKVVFSSVTEIGQPIACFFVKNSQRPRKKHDDIIVF